MFLIIYELTNKVVDIDFLNTTITTKNEQQIINLKNG